MELRYYLTFATVLFILQLFVYSFARTLCWLFNLSHSQRKTAIWASYIGANSLIVIHLLKLAPMFRPITLMLALLLFAFFVSALWLLIYWLFKRSVLANKLQKWLRISYPFAFISIVGFALYNAYTPKVVHYSIIIDKPLASMRIGVASDLHLGTLFGGKQLEQLAQIFENEKVDLILLPGDIMDDNVSAYLAENMQPHLAKLKAPLGVYATLGNHDFFGAQQQIAQEIQRAGIQVLWDQAVTFAGKFTIIGRNDDLYKLRPTTKQLLANVDTQLPIFLIDHRPTEIEQHSELPIDLQVSGHSHRGQIFPANLITALIYRLDYGYEKIGLGHYVVTSGYGFWGIPMRLGTQSEVVIIDIKGKG